MLKVSVVNIYYFRSMDTSQKADANGKCNETQANGHAQQETIPSTPTQTRTRSLDSAKIASWEPDASEKELIKLTWSDEFK